jgi:hypothetical protein
MRCAWQGQQVYDPEKEWTIDGTLEGIAHQNGSR